MSINIYGCALFLFGLPTLAWLIWQLRREGPAESLTRRDFSKWE